MTSPLFHPLVAATSTGDWMQDRLTEARGILADTTQHPNSLVILAARVIAGKTDSAREVAPRRGVGLPGHLAAASGTDRLRAARL